MLIIIDEKMSLEAKKTLSSYGELMELQTEGITYPAISGHPDIFFCQVPGKLIVAPNLPKKYFDQLDRHCINYITGELPVGPEYPASARYNAVVTSDYLIHNLRITDNAIKRVCQELTAVHVSQGYTRCNLLPLNDGNYITSDAVILETLSPTGTPSHHHRDSIPGIPSQGLHLKVSPFDILLEGFPHGFFGGCCGVWEDKVFINGSLKFYDGGEKVRELLSLLHYQIVELENCPLIDVGSILFIC